jgi:hypothetical protein
MFKGYGEGGFDVNDGETYSEHHYKTLNNSLTSNICLFSR